MDFVYVTRDSSKIIAVDQEGTLYILEGELRVKEAKPGELQEPPPGKPAEKPPGEMPPPPGPVNLEEVPEIERSFEDAPRSRFGGGGLESVDFKAMAELGVTWKRAGVNLMEPDFTLLDDQVKACQKAGMVLLVILDIPFPEIPPEEFARRAAEVVERYDGDGAGDMPGLEFPVIYYEVLNEVHGRPEWRLKVYKEYYVRAYEAIKEACAECRVAPSSFVGPDEKYLRFLKENNLEFDFLSYHSYTEYLDVDALTRLLEELGFGDVEIWLTESQFGGMERKLEKSEEEVAEAMVRSYVYALARGIDKVSPSELEAREYFPEGLKHSCLIDVDGRRKPAFYAYKTLISMVDGFTEARILSTNPYLVEFKLSDGTEIYVAWGEGKLPLTGKAKIVNIYGDREDTVDLSEFKLKGEPAYIKLIKAEEGKEGVAEKATEEKKEAVAVEEEKAAAQEQPLYPALVVLMAVIAAVVAVIVVYKRQGIKTV